MARLEIRGEFLIVRFSVLEKLGALRGNVRVPLEAVKSVSTSQRPLQDLGPALRVPGTYVPGLVALGTYHHRAGHDIAAIYRRRPAVVVELSHGRLRRLLISTDDAERVAATLARLPQTTARDHGVEALVSRP